MKAERGYRQYIEWDRIATEQGWRPAWVEDIGLAVGHYLNECIIRGQTPTFDRFFKHLALLAPKEDGPNE